MSLFGVPFEDFGGLDLTSAPNETAGAIDLLNVEFDQPGRVRARDGYAKFTSVAGAARYSDLGSFIGSYSAGAGTSTRQILAVRGTTLEALNTSGASVATVAVTASDLTTFARFGSPGSELVFIANGANTIRQWDGAAFTTPTWTGVTPTRRFVAVQLPDNRLVEAGANAAGIEVSRVRFSNPGVPTTIGINDYVDLHPGDGEPIVGMIQWRELLFVFKQSKFFVFTGNSSDGSGNPIFNYRPVTTGAGLVASRALAIGPDGVYFLARDGVYRTQGGAPQKISDAIEPLFTGSPTPFYTGSALNYASLGSTSNVAVAAMAFVNDRLYLAVPTGASTTNNRLLVYDVRTQNWNVWDIPAAALLRFQVTNPDRHELMFAYAAGTNDIGRWSLGAYTTDAGAAITSRYRGPFVPLDWRGRTIRSGIHGVDKVIRETLIEGTGTVSYTLSNQWATSLPTPRSVVLGTSPAVAINRDRTAVRGRMFSYQLSGTTPWSVQTVTWHVVGAYGAAGEQWEAA